MRISGSGTGGNGFHGSGGDRSNAFRKQYTLGQKIRGTLLKNISNSMAWVEIDGIRLLAQLEVAHAEGSRLLFIIKQLTPDIILKELPGIQATEGNALSLASAFDAARTLFEGHFRHRMSQAGQTTPYLTNTDFLEFLAQNPELYAGYMDAANCAHAISTELEASQKGRILYQPWLAPDSQRQITFIRYGETTTQLTETIIEFDHAIIGLVRVQFLYKSGTLSYKIKMQHLGHEKALQQYLCTRKYPGVSVNIQHLGTAKLPRNSHCGIIAEMLFKT